MSKKWAITIVYVLRVEKIFDSKIYLLLKREIKIFKICSFLKNIYHILYNEVFLYNKM